MTSVYYGPNIFRITDLDNASDPPYIEFYDSPLGFSEVLINLERDEWHGINFEWSDGDTELTFTLETGYRYLKRIYNQRGTEARIGFQYRNEDTGEVFIDLEFNFYGKPKFRGDRVVISIKKETFRERFRTRTETKVDLLSDKDLQGNFLTPLTPLSLDMPNKEIVLESSWKINPNIPTNFADHNGTGITDIIVPWEAQTSEIETTQSPPSGEFPVTDSPSYGILLTGPTLTGLAGRSFIMNGRIKFTLNLINADITPIWSVETLVIDPVGPTIVGQIAHGGGNWGSETPGTRSEDYLITNAVLLNVPFECYIAFAIRFDDTPEAGPYDMEIIYDQSKCFLELTETTDFPDSRADVVYIHEALNRAAEMITGRQNLLRSTALGRADAGYPADGCGSRLTVTNGFKLRNFPDTQITTDWRTLFGATKNLLNLGMSFEMEGDADVIVVDTLDKFYIDELGYTFQEVFNYEETPYDEIIYNEVRIAFRKYLTEELNTLDSVHTEHEYLTMIERHKNKLDIQIDAILDPYAIEFTRREQFSKTPTNSWKYDDDLCFIQTIGGGSFTQVGQAIGPLIALRPLSGGKGSVVYDGIDITDQAVGATHVELFYAVNGQEKLYKRALDNVSYDSITEQTFIQFIGAPEDTGDFNGAITFYINEEIVLAPEFDQPFDTVTGVIDPKTFYNLRHSPKSILFRYASWIKSGLYFAKDSDVIQNRNVKHNADLVTKFKKSETCPGGRLTSQTLREGDDIQMFELSANEPYFLPEIISFEAYLPWHDFLTIKANKYKYMQCTDSAGTIQAGWIKKIAYNPGPKLLVNVELIKKA